MDYCEAVDLALEKQPARSGQLSSITNSPGRNQQRPILRTKAEELSFRLFDGQSLQYSDEIMDGFYDIWGTFQGAKDNMPASQYPSLEILSQSTYTAADLREILVFDRTRDAKLADLYQNAKDVVERHRQAGPLVCVEALAKLVSQVFGGAQSHTDLLKQYSSCSHQLSQSKQSVVRYVGELQFGLSRHRCLLLKALSDSCGLPCRILRGDFYLGAAGASGENSVAVVQFNNTELMVELVTQPGRMYQLKKGTIPQLSSEALWGQEGTPGVEAGAVHKPHEQASASGYPTMPAGLDDDQQEVTRSDSNSSGQRDGLQWSEIDGPTMENLDESDTESLKNTGRRKSASEEREEHTASVDEQLIGLTRRLAFQRSQSGNQDIDVEQISSPLIPERIRRQASDPVQQGSGRASTSSERSSTEGKEWRDWREAETGQVTFDVSEAAASNIVTVGRYGSNPASMKNPARARVRGTDQRGRVIEFELEGLTLTSAHNLSSGQHLLSHIARQSEDSYRGRPVESMISRYRIIEPYQETRQTKTQTPEPPRQQGTGGPSSPIEDEKTPFSEAAKQEGGNLRLRVSSLAFRGEPKEYQKPQTRPWQETLRQFQSSLSDQNVPEASTLAESGDTRSASWERDERARAAIQSGPSSAHDEPLDRPVNNPAHTGALQLLSNPRFAAGPSLQQGQNVDSGLATRQSLAARIKTIDDGNFKKSHPPYEVERLGSDVTYHSVSDKARSQGRLSEESQASGGRTPSHSPTPQQQYHFDGQQMHSPSMPNRVSSAMFAGSDEDVEVNFSEVELGPRIGIGCFGEVFRARWRQTTVAVKRLFDQSLSEQSLREFRDEVQLNRRLKHPNVIMFMGACTSPPNLSIITQWAPRGSLFHLLHSTKPGRPKLALRQKLRMALDIARGMHYLHSAKPPIIHRDLKSMNLLVDNDLTIKVCDFGLARTRSSTWVTGRSQGGTPEWTAPEVLRNLNYNEKSDVYSFGVVLYELSTEKEPWDDMTPMQVVGAVGWGHQRLEPPPDTPKIFADLIKRCFLAPERRPSFEESIRTLLEYAPETRSQGGSEDL